MASFKVKFPVLQELFATTKKNTGALCPSSSGAPLALQIFHHLLGGGRFEHPPSISAPIGRREKREKAFESWSK